MDSVQLRVIILCVNKTIPPICRGVTETPLCNTVIFKAQSILVTEEGGFYHCADRF